MSNQGKPESFLGGPVNIIAIWIGYELPGYILSLNWRICWLALFKSTAPSPQEKEMEDEA